jgi:hypothetical protein
MTVWGVAMSSTPGDYNAARLAVVGFALTITVAAFLEFITPHTPPERILIGAVSALLVFVICPMALFWIDEKDSATQKRDALVALAGTLKSKGLVSLSPDGPIHPRIEVGNSGYFIDEKNPNDPYALIICPFLRADQLSVEQVDNSYKFSTTITDKDGKTIAKIVQNDWKISPDAWDRNYNNDSLEVIDDHGIVVLQVRLRPDRVQLQGIWWTDHSMWAPATVRMAIYTVLSQSMGRNFTVKTNGRGPMFTRLRAGLKKKLSDFSQL